MILGWLVIESQREAEAETHSKAVVECADRTARLAEDAGFTLYYYTKDRKNTSFRKKYFDAISRTREEIEKLKSLTLNDEYEHRLAMKAESLLKEENDIGNYVLDALAKSEPIQNRSNSPIKMELFNISNQFLETVHDLGRKEKDESERLSQHHFRGTVLPILGLGVIFNIALAIFLARYFNTGTTRRLQVLMDNSIKLAAGAELGEPLSGDDELSQLDQTFRSMAGALQEMTRKEKAIIENAVDVICSFDEKYTFLSASGSALDVFGWSAEQIIGKRLATLVPAAEFERLRGEFERVKIDGNAPYFESEVKRRNGSRADIRWAVQWSAPERSYYCIASDISARREVERLKQEFVSMMSHDLRTPLMSIQASLTLLSAGVSGTLSEAAAKHVNAAERNISYIISLINSLIDVERLESGLISINKADVDLAEIAQSALDAVRGLAANKQIALECHLSPTDIDADGDRILQVLINLLSNALKFSPAGSTIAIRSLPVGEFVEVQVCDQGRGIPQEQLALVFDRFKQVYKSDATVNMGSGLGLAICKSIIEAHGGSIGVRSVEGEGSTFWFRLPAGVVAPVVS